MSQPEAPRAVDPGQVEAIDGLRAISILAVVAYHVGLPRFGGGYVGVDVFFVISGYLIIGQILAGLRRGFSLSEFWGRRAIRILPPYLLVILATLALSSLVLTTPAEWADLGREVRWSAAMVVNHHFLGQQGYFDTASESKPLLHLWSLAVEEQFYLAAPLVLVASSAALSRVSNPEARRRLARGAAALLAAASFGLSVAFTDADRNHAFYLMPLRAWEFIVGGALGSLVPWARRTGPRAQSLLALAGLAAILGAVFGLSAETAFPSYVALLPVLGAAAVILAGVAHPGALVARALATRPMVIVGRLSYAFYLWHWPLLALTRLYDPRHRSLGWNLVAALVAFVLAALTHVLVELPLRRRRHLLTRGRGYRPALAGLAGCALIVALGTVVPGRLATASTLNAAWAPEYDPVDTECRIDLMSSPRACLARWPGAPVGLLMGDSQSKALHGALAAAAADRGAQLMGLARGGCAPFFHVKKVSKSRSRQETCEETERAALRSLDDPETELSFAILAGLWRSHARDLAPPTGDRPAADQRAIFIAKLRETLALLRRKGARRLLVIGQVPTYKWSPPECIRSADRRGKKRDARCTVTRSSYLAARAETHAWLEQAVAGEPDLRFIDPVDVFCDAKLCRPWDAKAALYINGTHLSNAGARRIHDAFRADFDWAFGAGEAR